MSKFLAQSKTFLPMVMQKSTTDAIQILEKYPALSTAQHEELPKQDVQKQVMPIPETEKQEPPKIEPLHQEILKQINSAPNENLKIVLHTSPQIPMDSCKIPEVPEAPVIAAAVEVKSPEPSKVVAVADSSTQKTLLRALILDLIQMQRKLLVLLSGSRVWLQLLSDRTRPGATSIVQSQLKEIEPVPLLTVARKKKEQKPKEEEVSEEKPPLKSNLWEAILENSPAWQKSISNQLGELQKTVVEKLSK